MKVDVFGGKLKDGIWTMYYKISWWWGVDFMIAWWFVSNYGCLIKIQLFE